MTVTHKPEPNWAPLEAIFPPDQCSDYMHMGHAGTIQLYKHRDTRKYLNICEITGSFFLYEDGQYVPIQSCETTEQNKENPL